MNHEMKRLSIAAGQTYELPHEARQVRMVSGEAWVSLGLDDVVVRRHQTLHIHPKRLAVYVTPLGRKNIEMVIATETSDETVTTLH